MHTYIHTYIHTFIYFSQDRFSIRLGFAGVEVLHSNSLDRFQNFHATFEWLHIVHYVCWRSSCWGYRTSQYLQNIAPDRVYPPSCKLLHRPCPPQSLGCCLHSRPVPRWLTGYAVLQTKYDLCATPMMAEPAAPRWISRAKCKVRASCPLFLVWACSWDLPERLTWSVSSYSAVSSPSSSFSLSRV